MAGIGDDLKAALIEVGASYLIIRDTGDVSGEYGLLEHSSQVTKPLTIEHFRRATIPHDSQLVTGDIIEFTGVGEYFITTNMIPEIFENAAVQYDTVLYKCNIRSGELLRPSGEVWGNDYHKEIQWEVIKNNCYAMQIAALYGNELNTEQEAAILGLQKDEVLLPHSAGAMVGDRWQPASGEYYMISTIETRRYPNVDVLVVEEDRR